MGAMDALTPTCVLAVDVVIMTVREGALAILLGERRHAPWAGHPALPGVLVRDGETETGAVRRTLTTKVDGAEVFLSQVGAFASPDRDPRGRVVSVAWGALVSTAVAGSLCGRGSGLSLARVSPEGDTVTDADGAALCLAFDHATIVARTVAWLRGRLGRDLTGAEMLGETFSLRELQEVHEAVLGKAIVATNFNTWLKRRGVVVPTGGRADRDGRGRPGMLYRVAARPASPWEE